MRLSLLTLLLLLAAGPALAHAGHGEPALHWNFEAWLTISLAAASLAYFRGWRRMRGRAIGHIEAFCFAAGILALILALQSPLDPLGEDLFSAHMAQHLMLMLVAAPLFVRARPLVAFLWAMPRGLRRWFGRWWGGGPDRVFAALTSPVSVWISFCGLFVFWHIPGPYGWALRHEPVHVLEHLCFFVSAYAFWSVVIEPSGNRRLDHGATLMFVATAAVLSGLPGALMVLTQRPFYPIHAAGAARWGLSLIDDQQLAGLIMWIPAGFAYLAAILVLFARWLRVAEERAQRRARRALTSAATLGLCLLALPGCGKSDEEPNAGASATGFGGDPRRGAKQIAEIGCGACHTIPGISGADALVGPPLDKIGRRIFLAGYLRNTPDNMIAWIKDPQKVLPGNAMPDMKLTQEQARDIAAYLYTLK
ncbi:MAG TPA: cytochrome c oxidase assembly protein [Stellaceae bacterium]